MLIVASTDLAVDGAVSEQPFQIVEPMVSASDLYTEKQSQFLFFPHEDRKTVLPARAPKHIDFNIRYVESNLIELRSLHFHFKYKRLLNLKDYQ